MAYLKDVERCKTTLYVDVISLLAAIGQRTGERFFDWSELTTQPCITLYYSLYTFKSQFYQVKSQQSGQAIHLPYSYKQRNNARIEQNGISVIYCGLVSCTAKVMRMIIYLVGLFFVL